MVGDPRPAPVEGQDGRNESRGSRTPPIHRPLPYVTVPEMEPDPRPVCAETVTTSISQQAPVTNRDMM